MADAGWVQRDEDQRLTTSVMARVAPHPLTTEVIAPTPNVRPAAPNFSRAYILSSIWTSSKSSPLDS